MEMNTQRNAGRRIEEEIAIVGAPPHGDQVPPLLEGENDDEAPVNTLPLTDENIWSALLQIKQAITTQAQAATAQAQAMTAQATRRLYLIKINKFLPWPLA